MNPSAWLLDYLSACWALLAAMAPYLLLGFAVAGALSVLVAPAWVERHLGAAGHRQVFKASLFGVPLPLCSCGVIPVAASLRQHGASRGATTAFLLSTPQTGVDSIAATWGLMSPFLAVFRPAAALVTGWVGGLLVDGLDEPPRDRGEALAGAATCALEPAGPRWRRALRYGFVTLPRDIGKSLAIGIFAAALITTLVPEDALAPFLGSGARAWVLAALLGIPIYVCATGSIPIAVGLLHAGLSPGAALVFLITGPATNAATLTTVWRILGRRASVLFLATVGVGGIAAGALVDVAIAAGWVAREVVLPVGSVAHAHGGADETTIVGHLWAAALTVLLAIALVPRRRSRAVRAAAGEIALSVQGMRCEGCVGAVQRALVELPGVEAVEVDLAGARALVRGSALQPAALAAAVTGLGYPASPT